MNSCIGRTSIDEKIRMKLWAVSGGRCELCNKLLYQDSTFGHDGNFGEMAHIHAVSEGGPRHKIGMSNAEKNNIDNLMLLCAEHHHLVDTFPEDFGEGLLIEKKKKHEARIREVTGISCAESCRIITYFSNIDAQQEFSSERLLKEAVLFSGCVPMREPVIELNADSYTKYEPTKENFELKVKQLEQNFQIWFKDIIKSMDKIGVFALAPQPLLFILGTLINDKYNTKAFQLHRTGHKWAWPSENEDEIDFIFERTKRGIASEVALVIDLSAKVLDDRIVSILGDNLSIFHITVLEPNRNFVTNEKIQDEFVSVFRKAMEEIKNIRPIPQRIHLFSVMPNSLNIRAGMDYMPKTDLPIVLYEQAAVQNGFFEAITINNA